MVLFWLIFAVIVAIVAVVSKKENDEEQAQQEPKKSDEDVLANAQRLLALTEAATQAKESGHDDVYQAIMSNTYDGHLPERRAEGVGARLEDRGERNPFGHAGDQVRAVLVPGQLVQRGAAAIMEPRIAGGGDPGA